MTTQIEMNDPVDEVSMEDVFKQFVKDENAEVAIPDPVPVAQDEPANLDDIAAEVANVEGEAPTTEEVAEIAPKADATQDTLQQILDSLKQAQQPEPKNSEPEPAPAPAIAAKYTAEEQAVLDNYTKEWPDVYKAESLIRRQEYADLVDGIFKEITRELAPVMQFISQQVNTTHEATIRGAHKDYDDIYPKVGEWINQQPAFLKNAYAQIASKGTAEDVVAMLNQFKKETGITNQAVAPAAVKETPPAIKQAAQRLAPVASKRSVVPQVDDDMDEETAFKRFAKEA
jgi:hypothetical protein